MSHLLPARRRMDQDEEDRKRSRQLISKLASTFNFDHKWKLAAIIALDSASQTELDVIEDAEDAEKQRNMVNELIADSK